MLFTLTLRHKKHAQYSAPLWLNVYGTLKASKELLICKHDPTIRYIPQAVSAYDREPQIIFLHVYPTINHHASQGGA